MSSVGSRLTEFERRHRDFGKALRYLEADVASARASPCRRSIQRWADEKRVVL